MSSCEATLALMAILGASCARYHTYDEVDGWYCAEGLVQVWGVNESRRCFGVCGHLPEARPTARFAGAAVHATR